MASVKEYWALFVEKQGWMQKKARDSQARAIHHLDEIEVRIYCMNP